MLDSKQREAHLLQARERLARAFARLETLIGGYTERVRLLESSRDKSQQRVKEIEELLERERAITEQRNSLSESASEEMQALRSQLEKIEKQLAERDKKIFDLEKNLDERVGELMALEKAHTEAVERELKSDETITRLEGENFALVRQLELLKEERENMQKQIAAVEEKDSSYALTFSQDERLGLLKTIDSLIERVDLVAGHHAEVLK
jgi:chromosome segregation ATPase